LSSWLGGRTAFRPVHLVEAIYRNRYSVPSSKSVQAKELSQSFHGTRDPKEYHYARPGLSTWATQLVGKRCALEVGQLGYNDPAHPNFHVFLQSSANSRIAEKRKTVSQEDVFQFSMQRSADILQSRAPMSWFLTESMSATRKNGEIIAKTRRPHPFIQVAALSSFAMARNRSANAYFALPVGTYLFATKAHTDVKRMFCKLGLSVHDTTARNALISMGAKRKEALQAYTIAALEKKEPAARKTLDNIQQYQIVREHGLCKRSQLITGTAATAIMLDNCAEHAFDLDTYQDRVIRNERASLTVDALLDDIDFDHMDSVFALHVVRILCEHVPCLNAYLPLIAERFRSQPIALYLLPVDRPATRIVPLSCNSRAEMETHEMKEAVQDFDRQVGYTPENVSAARILIWEAGDGGSVLSGGRVAHHLLLQGLSLNTYESFENRFWTPGLFHVQMNMINGVAENHFSAKATSDPSSLSRAASLASLYIPSKPNSCEYYPTTRTMDTICSAQFLDIWDLEITQHRGLLTHFEQLNIQNKLPSLDDLLTEANKLVHRYSSDRAYQTALSSTAFNKSPDLYKFKIGTPADPDSVGDSEFTGDRVLANTIAFRRDYLLYFELSDAILEGDIGRVCEVLKLLTFFFAGASKYNYAGILLDLYCLFKFEATEGLKEAIWNNWVVNLTGEPRKNVPDDQLQEWYNKFHEAMVPRHGGSFDDPFFRETISPNVNFFQRLKEEMEEVFGLKAHRKSHTSAGITSEIRALTAMYKRESVHLFCAGQIQDHKAKDLIDNGYTTLEKTKLADLLRTSTERAEVLAMIRRHRQHGSVPESHRNAPDPDTMHGDGDSSDNDSTNTETSDPNSDNCDDPHAGDSQIDDEEPVVGGSDWAFRMDEGRGRIPSGRTKVMKRMMRKMKRWTRTLILTDGLERMTY
ncbi:hypothetical protein B0H14DRAFT_2380960, partial [Mycena olivaceomarginata]